MGSIEPHRQPRWRTRILALQLAQLKGRR